MSQPWNFQKSCAECIKHCFARQPMSTRAPDIYKEQFKTLSNRFVGDAEDKWTYSAQPGLQPENLGGLQRCGDVAASGAVPSASDNVVVEVNPVEDQNQSERSEGCFPTGPPPFGVESQSAADGQSSTSRSVVARQSRGAATKLAGSLENRDVSDGRCCGMPCGQH